MQHASASAQKAMDLENKYGAHNYHPLPVVLERGEGVYVLDVDGKKYYDFLSAYSAVNQGHCHPEIIKAMNEQSQKLTLTSRAFYNDKLGPYEAYLSSYFKYDKALPMNTGAEAVETALKFVVNGPTNTKTFQKDRRRSLFVVTTFMDGPPPSFLSQMMPQLKPTLVPIHQDSLWWTMMTFLP